MVIKQKALRVTTIFLIVGDLPKIVKGRIKYLSITKLNNINRRWGLSCRMNIITL